MLGYGLLGHDFTFSGAQLEVCLNSEYSDYSYRLILAIYL